MSESSSSDVRAIQRILLADDDPALTAILQAALREEGFQVEIAANGREALARFEAAPPDLVILDVLMPEMDGLEVCRRIRRKAQTPVILLTSRGEEIDKITGLETGADDYVTKPFSTRELVARIRALGRRVGGFAEKEVLTAGDLVVNVPRFEARWKGIGLVFTRSEFDVLAALVRQRGVVLSRDRLIDLARGADVTITDRTIDTFIKRIRKKLRDADATFNGIETVIGVGYRYRV